jgi:hypothetical protein
VSRYCVDMDKIWKNLIDFKYTTCEPNIFKCGDVKELLIFGRGLCGQQW